MDEVTGSSPVGSTKAHLQSAILVVVLRCVAVQPTASGRKTDATLKGMELAGLLAFVLYIAQQSGIIASVGAATVVLCATLLKFGDSSRTPLRGTYEYIPHAAEWIEKVGLGVVVISGVGVVVLHVVSSQIDVLLAPAFIFKWLLVAIIVAFYAARAYTDQLPAYMTAVVQGVAGAQWFALLVLHGLAPVTSWALLSSLYITWVAAFTAVWMGCVWLMRGSRHSIAIFTSAFAPGKVFANATTLMRSSIVATASSVASEPAVLHPAPSIAPRPSEKSRPTPVTPPVTAHPLPAVAHRELPASSEAHLETPVKVVPEHHDPVVRHPQPAPPPRAAMRIVPAPAPVTSVQPEPAPKPAPYSVPAVRVMPRSPEELQHAI